MRVRKLLICAAAVLLLAPATAGAQWLITPYAGGSFGGDSVDDQLAVGASIGYMGGGIVGFEVDFGYTPEFFGDESVVGSNNVVSLMGNLIVGVPLGDDVQVRPYVTGGAGLLRSRIDGVDEFFDEVEANDFGFNAGAGVMFFFNEVVGLRGDVRYFRNVTNDDDERDLDLDLSLGNFDFWRGTVGLSFRF